MSHLTATELSSRSWQTLTTSVLSSFADSEAWVQIRLTSTCNINFIIFFNLKVFWEKFKKKINRNMKIFDQLHSLVISYRGSLRTDCSQSSSYRRKENQSKYKPLTKGLYHLLTHT